MNRQATLNKVVNSLREQGRPALGPDGEPVYINNDGCRCSVGCLITEEQARRWDLDGTDIFYGSFLQKVFPGASHQDGEFLRRLQQPHDKWVDGEPFPKEGFAKIAYRYGLVMPGADL